MKKIKMMLASLFTAASVALIPVSVGAISVLPQCTSGATAVGSASVDSVCAASGTDSINSIIKNVVDILLYIVGAVSVIMLIVGGLRYATSAGNSNSVAAAKSTIMYALIGLGVSVLAYAIVQFVIGAITTGKAT
jgi:hypothetical protein